ncbi:hypothetical protein P6B95_00545 [Streptomyces atratus]|uniref:hypothetical protein n=1 Tax=Streptomyces atratus TaxID=1893 RepID=UPI0016702362|nr:hypothetical protein [Streptomyces atratus]WPW26114.1 hypothetical protein P6B95_00545 [Streptomyces atratus]
MPSRPWNASPKNTTTPAPADLPHRHDADRKKTMDTPAQEEFATVRGRAWDVLTPARAGCPASVFIHCEKVFHEATQRTEHVGGIGKAGIARMALCCG